MKALNCKGRLLPLDQPVVMGILNITPDSFYAGSRKQTEAEIAARAEAILQEGGTIIDIGGYSSRPDAAEVSEEEEMARLETALRVLNLEFPDAVLSVDTFRSAIARRCVEEFGVAIVNDISGGELDKDMFHTIADLRVPYVMMHMRGTPQTMQNPENLVYGDVCAEVASYLQTAFERAVAAGIHPDSILLDPGLGFAKTQEQNFELVRGASKLRERVEAPLFYAPSRKSFLSHICEGKKPAERDYATAGVLASLTAQKIEFVRVHNVPMALESMTAFFRCNAAE